MSFDWNSLIPVLIPVLLPFAVALYKHFEVHLPQNVRELVHSEATVVVSAIEQQCGSANNPMKKAQAVADLKAILASFHISASEVLINSAIESAVLAMKQQAPEPPSAPAQMKSVA